MDQDWSRHRCRKAAWLQSITYGTTIPGDSDLTFRTATWRSCQNVASECMLWVATIGDPISRVRGVQAPVMQTVVVCWRVHEDGR